jgi:hypothetical protein
VPLFHSHRRRRDIPCLANISIYHSAGLWVCGVDLHVVVALRTDKLQPVVVSEELSRTYILAINQALEGRVHSLGCRFPSLRQEYPPERKLRKMRSPCHSLQWMPHRRRQIFLLDPWIWSQLFSPPEKENSGKKYH